jgi:uncharacterized protein YjiS (DUF1127 family)
MLFAYFIKPLQMFFDRKRAEAELNGLTDRALEDIGVSRGDIPRIARFGR